MMTIKGIIQSFKKLEGETIHETWMWLKKPVLQCPTHGLQGLMQLPYVIAAYLLDSMTKINRA